MANGHMAPSAPIRNIELANISSSQLLQELAQAKAERRKVAAIVESIDNGVIAVDWDGKIVLVNRASEQLTGWSRRDILGHYYWEVFPLYGADQKPIPLNQHPLIEAFSLDAQLQLDDIFILAKSGNLVNVALNASPIKGVKNDIVSGIMTFRDIRKQKELEKMQEDFVSMAAHELRTPIVPLKGYLEILRDEASLSEEHRTFLMRAMQSISRLESLVNSLLSVARIERGSIAFNPESLDYKSLVEGVIHDQTTRFETKKQTVRFSVVPDGPVPAVVADAQLIREVLDNLVGNAIKYTPDGGEISIWIEVATDKIVTHIKDNGIGLDEEAKKYIFEKFHRAGDRLTSSIEGTGLGLYISKSLVERHGGRIWVESAGKGKGSVFSFSLPVQNEKVQPKDTQKVGVDSH